VEDLISSPSGGYALFLRENPGQVVLRWNTGHDSLVTQCDKKMNNTRHDIDRC
jgi:hypothetical protein